MIEAKGNMWDAEVDAFVITTNGFVKKNGEAVMGRGCAKEASTYWPKFPKLLGNHINKNGNVVGLFTYGSFQDGMTAIFTFPVKYNWWEKADSNLIEKSCKELVNYVESIWFGKMIKIAIPRPGCGNGQLDWEDVKPILEKYLDDRFIVYDY